MDGGASTTSVDQPGTSATARNDSGVEATTEPTTTPPAVTSDSGETDVAATQATDETGIPESDAGSQLDAWSEATPLFSHTYISQVAIALDAAAEDALRADAGTYVHGDIEVRLADDQLITLRDVGVRLKGQWGSARNLDQKAAFLIKTNAFVKGQKLFGLSKLALNNMVQDPSMIHEQLAYLLFRDMGVAAPRTGYATVSFNEQAFGLYAAIEVVDNESFLNHWYGSDDGNLYEGAYGSDLVDGLIDTYDQDRGEDVAFADLRAVTTAIGELPEASPFMSAVGQYIDTEHFARFVATELMLAHWDGYAVTKNNYFLYPDATGRWTFIPWGLDQTFGDSNYGLWSGDARVQTLCAGSQDCRNATATAYARLMELWDELDLLTRVDALEALIHDAVEADTRKEYGTDSVWSAIEQTRQFLRDRPTAVRGLLVCTDPSDVDVDADGASGCGQDCDDNNPDLFPGAAEACNWRDDNCDGQVDEVAECPGCFETQVDGFGRYALCFHGRDFAAAQVDCEDQGGGLVALHSEQEQAALIQVASDQGLPRDYWIGLSDRDDEGDFQWEDGSDVDYLNWGGGEPNDFDEEDCAQLTGSGAWNDLDCGASLAYICRLP